MTSGDRSFIPECPKFDDGRGIPPRSRLFALEPIGVGTPIAEGLTSYIIRLAEAHSVSPRRLIREEFARLSPEIAKYRQSTPFFNKYAACINGLRQYSELFADVVEKLCGLSAARNLTLLPLKSLLPFNGAGLGGPGPRWCSTCYAEMRESRREIYQPLAWSFNLYQVCSRHGKSMIDRCPSCNRFQYLIPQSPVVGYCYYCGTWLGKRSDQPLPAPPFELWIATAIEEIVAELPRLGKLATLDRFISQLKDAINYYANGIRRKFCREIGLPEVGFQIWINSGQRPSLARWLAISYGMDIGPIQFLKKEFVSVSEKAALHKLPCTLKPRAVCPQLTTTQRQAIQAELGAVAETGRGIISVTELAKGHQLARRHLQSLWPELCRKISSDYRETARIRWKEELARKRRVTVEIVDTLLERGIYPSQRIVRDALDRIGLSLANPAIRDAYKQQLKTRLGEKSTFVIFSLEMACANSARS